jgi:predicted type IV restriction endonuclease
VHIDEKVYVSSEDSRTTPDAVAKKQKLRRILENVGFKVDMRTLVKHEEHCTSGVCRYSVGKEKVSFPM